MAVSAEEKEKVFALELERIHDSSIREFTRLCITQAPDYFFFDCPASSSGKYHPVDELCWDGTLIHTKKVFTVAYELVKGYSCEGSRDQVVAACLIHDLLKQGKKRTGHTVKDHPNLAAELVKEVHDATQILTEADYAMIRNSVGYHYGPWSIDPWKKPLDQYTPEEMCVYMSDYVASKRFIAVDYRRE